MKTVASQAGKTSNMAVKNMITIGMLAAIAVILMLFEFPIPFLAPGFYQVWDKLTLSGPGEEEFRQAFNVFIRPQQDLQNSRDLFLKQRFAPVNPQLSNAALHKFLKKDEQYLGFSLAPKYLHQSYILLFLAHHRQLSDRDLEDALKLDPASLLYYQRLLLHANQ